MYKRSNLIVTFAVLFSICGLQAFEINAHADIGVQTNNFHIINDRFLDKNYLENQRKWKVVANGFDYHAPEFLDVVLSARVPVYEETVWVKPFVGAALLSHRAKLGVDFSSELPIHYEDVRIEGFASIYHHLFLKEIVAGSGIMNQLNIDVGAQAFYPLIDYADLYATVRYPLIMRHTYQAFEQEICVDRRPSLTLGVRFSFSKDFDDMRELVIQEPIAIPVVDLVIEEPMEEEQYIEIEDVKAVPEAPVAEEELGWFAWIIEFIARLFRF